MIVRFLQEFCLQNDQSIRLYVATREEDIEFLVRPIGKVTYFAVTEADGSILVSCRRPKKSWNCETKFDWYTSEDLQHLQNFFVADVLFILPVTWFHSVPVSQTWKTTDVVLSVNHEYDMKCVSKSFFHVENELYKVWYT